MQTSSPLTANTGLWVPTMETDTEASVYEILSESPPSETNLLVISHRKGPDNWIGGWQTQVGTTPANLGFVHVGEVTRSTAASSPSALASSSPPFLTAISDPTDLTGLGIQISEYLKEWTATDNQITVYFDSLSVLLQFCELNRVYRFLHVLSGRIKSVNGRAYYRLDPDAHDTQTISTIQNLMDEIIELP